MLDPFPFYHLVTGTALLSTPRLVTSFKLTPEGEVRMSDHVLEVMQLVSHSDRV